MTMLKAIQVSHKIVMNLTQLMQKHKEPAMTLTWKKTVTLKKNWTNISLFIQIIKIGRRIIRNLLSMLKDAMKNSRVPTAKKIKKKCF